MTENKCEHCDKTPEEFSNVTKKLIKEHGFVTHVVPNGHLAGVNAHTHGLLETYGHLDFQIVLPIKNYFIHEIFHYLADNIKRGEKYLPYFEYRGIILNHSIKFLLADESNRTVLRMILPDKEGQLGENAQKEFRAQLLD